MKSTFKFDLYTSTMSLEGKVINGFIAVDHWKRDNNAYVHFLTRISAEVTDAISEDWDTFIFTSVYNIKLMKEFTTIKHEYLMPLKPFVQSTIQITDERTIFVTLIPTKNVSGNVMYHFIDDVGEEILYTGYFQHEPELIDNEYLKQLTSRKSISVMYMDNALWYYPRIRFTLKSALNKILHVISEYPDYRFILGLNATGCESLLIQLVHNGLEVYPGESRLIMLNKAGCSQMFSNNKRALIRVVDVHQIYKHDCERRFKEKKIVTMICNLGCTKKTIQQFSADHLFVITYGEHCTYSDAKLFINAIQPNKLLPIITSIPHQTPISLNGLCRKGETENDISKDSSVSFIPLGQKSPSRQIIPDSSSVEPQRVSLTKPPLNDGTFSISLYNDFSPFIGGEDIPQRAVITTKQMAPTQTDDLEFNINTQSDFHPPFTSTQQTLSQKTGQRALHVIEEEPGEESINGEMLPPSQFSQLPSQKKKNNMNRYIELSEDQLRNKNKFSRSHIWEIFNANSVNRVSVVSNVKKFKDAECQTDLLADDITLRQKQISVEENVLELRTIEEEGEENDLDYSTQTYITIRPIEKNVVFNSAFNVYHDISNEDVENVSPSVVRSPGKSLNESFSPNTQTSKIASQEVTINKTYIIQKSIPNNSINLNTNSIDMFDNNSLADPNLIQNVHVQPETNPLVNELEHGTWSNNVEIIENQESQIVYMKSEYTDEQFEEEIPNIGGSVEILSEEVNSVSQVDLVLSSDSLEDILNPNIQACKIILDDVLKNHKEAGDVTLQLVRSGEPQHMQHNIIVNVQNVPEMILETSYEMSSLCDSDIIAAYPCESRTEIALEKLPVPASCKMIEPDSENEETDIESPLRLAPIDLKIGIDHIERNMRQSMKQNIQTDSNRQTEGPNPLQETVDKLNNQKYVSSNDQSKKNYEMGSSSKSVKASENKQVQLQEAIVIDASSSEEGDDNIADGTVRDQSTAYGSVGDASLDEVTISDVYIGYHSVENVPSDISVSSSSDSEHEEETRPRASSPIVSLRISEESSTSNSSTCSRKMNPCISQMISRINPDISPTIYHNISSRHSARSSPVEVGPYTSVRFSPDLVHCQNMSSSNETAEHISSDNISQISMTTVEKSQFFNKCNVRLERLDTETIDKYLRRNTKRNHKTESKSYSKNKSVHMDKIDAYAKYFKPLNVSHKGRMQLDDADRDIDTKNINQIRNFSIRRIGKQSKIKSFTRKRKRNVSSDDERLQRKNKSVHMDKIDAYAKYFPPLIVTLKGRMQLDADRDIYMKNINQIRNFSIRRMGNQSKIKSFTRKRKRNVNSEKRLQRKNKEVNTVNQNVSVSSDDEPAKLLQNKKKTLTRKSKK